MITYFSIFFVTGECLLLIIFGVICVYAVSQWYRKINYDRGAELEKKRPLNCNHKFEIKYNVCDNYKTCI